MAAYQYGIPADLLAGVTYIEFGGKPQWFDDAGDWARQNDLVSGDPNNTSYGPLSIQVDTAARALGYDAHHLSSSQREAIISSLKDPEQSIMIAAKVLHDAKQATDFALIEPEALTDAQIRRLAATNNGGPDWSEAVPQGYADSYAKHVGDAHNAMQ